MKYAIVIILMFLRFSAFGGDFDIPAGFPKAYDEVFRLELKTGKTSVSHLPKGSPFRIYLENYLDFIEIFNADQEVLFNQAAGNESKRLKQLEELDPGSPYHRFLRAEILIHWALLKIKFGKETKGAYNAIQAAKLLDANQRAYPEFLPTYKSLGSIHVVLGSVPDNYSWALKLLGVKGGVAQGFSELEKASGDKIWGNEALYSSFYLKTFTARFSKQDEKALIHYVNTRPRDLNAHFLATSILIRQQNTGQAQDVLNGKPGGENFLYIPVFELQRGDILAAKGAYKPAVAAYLNYLRNFKGKTYLKEIHLKLYMTHRILGENEKAEGHLRKISVTGNLTTDYDKTAQKYYTVFRQTTPPDSEFLQAKLSISGGFYHKAFGILAGIDGTRLEKEIKAEYYQLLGVANYKSGNREKAFSDFDRALALSEELRWNGGSAAAALQLGYFYQTGNQNAQARLYFEKALSYKNHEQKNTIDMRARAALDELKHNQNQIK